MAKATKPKTSDKKDEPVKLNMSFEEAMKLAATTPKPKKKAKK